MKELLEDIKNDFDFVGKSYDKNGNFLSNYYLYSKTVALFPTEIKTIQTNFPDFTITHLYNRWYIIGFNKK